MVVDENIMLNCALPLWLKCNYYFTNKQILPLGLQLFPCIGFFSVWLFFFEWLKKYFVATLCVILQLLSDVQYNELGCGEMDMIYTLYLTSNNQPHEANEKCCSKA